MSLFLTYDCFDDTWQSQLATLIVSEGTSGGPTMFAGRTAIRDIEVADLETIAAEVRRLAPLSQNKLVSGGKTFVAYLQQLQQSQELAALIKE